MADSQTEQIARNLARLGQIGYSAEDLFRLHRNFAERQRRVDEYLRLRGVKRGGEPITAAV